MDCGDCRIYEVQVLQNLRQAPDRRGPGSVEDFERRRL